MCDCIDWYYVIVLICIVLFFQILMYKLGCIQGEKIAYKRYLATCNVCRNKKNELVGKIDKFNSCKKCNSSEKSNSWRLI